MPLLVQEFLIRASRPRGPSDELPGKLVFHFAARGTYDKTSETTLSVLRATLPYLPTCLSGALLCSEPVCGCAWKLRADKGEGEVVIVRLGKQADRDDSSRSSHHVPLCSLPALVLLAAHHEEAMDDPYSRARRRGM